jgi:predicted ribosomally synthesized peptide with nif11-like leader
MLNNLRDLLQNSQLQAKIKAATDKASAIELLILAGAEKGYTFTAENISAFLAEVNNVSHELSEDDLLVVSGGLPPASELTIYKCRYTREGNIC